MSDKYIVAVDHIDLAFVYPEEELAEYLDTVLERVLQLMRRNPEAGFALEQVWHYRSLQERRPDLFEQVRQRLKEGRMEFMGAMASSADTNFPNGECLVRNQLLGMEWAAENLNTAPDSAWLVDTFGINAQVPQIMRQFGFTRLFANRFGGNKRNDLFYARGLDGSRILVLGRDLASRNIFPDTQAFYFCRSRKDIGRLYELADSLQAQAPHLVVYYIENETVFSEYYLELAEQKRQRGTECWKPASYREYTEALEKAGFNAPVLDGDLNPEFTGTFALRGRIKTENRRAETALLEAEKWCALFRFRNYREELEECWWELFRNQFHDAFSGSLEDESYFRVLERFQVVRQRSEQAIRMAVSEKSGNGSSITFLNGLPWRRKAWIPLEEGECVCDEKGKPLPVGEENGRKYALIDIPAVGTVTQNVRPVEWGTISLEESGKKEIENDVLKLSLDEREGIRCLQLTDGKRIMENASDFLTVQQDNGGMQIEDCNGVELYAVNEFTKISVKKSGTMGQQITMSGEIPKLSWCSGPSWLKWRADFSVRKGEPAVRLHLSMDWRGERARIRLKLPCLINAGQAVYEIPFGMVERTSYEDRSTAKGEWPAHRFVVYEDPEAGLAVVNRGIAGVELAGRTLEITLLRAYGNGPDAWVKPTEISSQNGKLEYDFMLIPYKGSWKQAGVLQLAQEFNQEVRRVNGCSCGALGSWLSIDRPNLVLSCIKEAQDGSGELVVRFYETFGEETEGTLWCREMERVWKSDVAERKKEEMNCGNETVGIRLAPFEILTLRIRRR